jgi:PAS domain S-box-containing protein
LTRIGRGQTSVPELRILQLLLSDDAARAASCLAGAGYNVSSRRVDCIGALLEALESSDWDLVLSDFRSSALDAVEALKAVRDAGLDCPFIVISGVCSPEVAEREMTAVFAAGAADYLTLNCLPRLAPAVSRELRAARSRRDARRVEAELAESRERLALTLEACDLGTFDYYPQTGRVFFEGSIRAFLSLKDGEHLSFEESVARIHPADRQSLIGKIEKALHPSAGGYCADEFRIDGEDGQYRWINAAGRVSFDSEGRPIRFIGGARDITVRKAAELAAQFERGLAHSIAQQALDAIWVADETGHVRFVNSEAVRMFGYSAEEWERAHPHDLVHHHYPDLRPFPVSECGINNKQQSGQTLRDHEDVFFHKNGAQIPISITMAPLDMGDGRIGSVCTVRDISQKLRTEQALRDSEERLRRLVEADVVGIVIGDEEIIHDANDYFLELLQYSREELRAGAIRWSRITPFEHSRASLGALRTLRKAGACPAFEKEYFRKDGTRVPVLVGGVVTSSSGPFRLLGFVVDLTERKNLEDQIRQAQKMESIGMLAGSVAHDFNNLVTVILGYSAQMAEVMSPGDPFFDPLKGIYSAASKAPDLTGKLLAFSRRAPGIPRVLDLNEVIRETEKILRRLIGEKISVVVSLDAAPSYIRADPGHIDQVIMNLALNARDAMPKGGRLYLETTRTAVEDDFASSCLSVPHGQYVTFSVSDTGSGMAPDVMSRIFEPFFTTKEPGRGTGLGLSTVYGIVRQAGGAINVHSAPGMGSTFRVLLPAQISGPEAEPPEHGEYSLGGSETVLLVEDEDDLRTYVRTILEGRGYSVRDAATGEDALQLARRCRLEIDLLLTDTVLPGMSGQEIADELRSTRPELPVIQMSGYAEVVARRGQTDSHFLQKPFTAKELLREIRAALKVTALE